MKQRLWTPTILVLTILMLILFFLTFYFGYVLNLLWCVGLGLIYGVTLGFSYYYEIRRRPSISLLYITQAAVIFIIIMAFVRFQSIFGPHSFGYDYFILASSMLFAGGVFGIPAYRYARIKPKPTIESATETRVQY